MYSFARVFILRPSLFPYKGCRTPALRSACKTNQDDFTDWMYFLPSNLMEETSHNSGINALIY